MAKFRNKLFKKRVNQPENFNRDDFFSLILKLHYHKDLVSNQHFIYILSVEIFLNFILMAFIGGFAFISMFIFVLISIILMNKNQKYEVSEEVIFLNEKKSFFNQFEKYFFKMENDQLKEVELKCFIWSKNIKRFSSKAPNSRFLIPLILLEFIVFLYIFLLVNPLINGFFNEMVKWNPIDLNGLNFPIPEVNENLLLLFTSSLYILSFIPIPILFVLERYEIYKIRYRKIISKINYKKNNEIYKGFNEIVKSVKEKKNIDLITKEIKREVTNIIDILNFNLYEDISQFEGNLIRFYTRSEIMNLHRVLNKYEILISKTNINENKQVKKAEFKEIMNLIELASKIIQFEVKFRFELYDQPKLFHQRIYSKWIGIISLILTVSWIFYQLILSLL